MARITPGRAGPGQSHGRTIAVLAGSGAGDLEGEAMKEVRPGPTRTRAYTCWG